MNSYCWVFIVVLAIFQPISVDARQLHSERSLYRNILVTEESGRRCLLFGMRDSTSQQSCRMVRDAKWLVFPYTRMMLAGLLVNPSPQRILIVGLGGGSIPRALAELVPGSHTDVVEIDEAVVRVAENYFEFKANDRMQVHAVDARVFIKRALARKQRYDMILLDAFTGDYIPEHLMTTEFLKEVQQLMGTDGVLIANTFAISRLYDHESTTYRSVFGPFFNLRHSASQNRIIVAANKPLPQANVLMARAQSWRARLEPYHVEILEFAELLTLDTDWDTEARILTDEFSPANILRAQERQGAP